MGIDDASLPMQCVEENNLLTSNEICSFFFSFLTCSLLRGCTLHFENPFFASNIMIRPHWKNETEIQAS